MAKSKLNQVAENIGSAMGKADRTAHQVAKNIGSAVDKADRTAQKVAKAGVLARKELKAISNQVDALKKQLQKTTKKLKNSLS